MLLVVCKGESQLEAVEVGGVLVEFIAWCHYWHDDRCLVLLASKHRNTGHMVL